MDTNSNNKIITFIKDHKKSLTIISLLALPIVIGQLIRIPLGKWTIGDENSWVGFFGSYAGAIIGGLVAYVISKTQIQSQRKNEEKKTIEANRSYLIITDFESNFKLHNIITNSESRIMLTSDYQSYIYNENKDLEFLRKKNTDFYKLRHYGNPQIILDCKVEIFYKNRQGNLDKLEVHLGVITKEEEVFIPLYSKEYKGSLRPTKVEVSYRTISNENMFYLYDVNKNKSVHYVMKEVNGEPKREEIFSFNIENSTWIYPNKKIIETKNNENNKEE